MRWRAILSSRFFYVPAVLILVTLGWNIYVAAHDHGIITGRVVNADGTPASGATVVFYERNIVSRFLEKSRLTTDAQGRFRITGNTSHQVRLDAIGTGGGRSEPRIVRLWFAAQDLRVRTPLVLAAPKG